MIDATEEDGTVAALLREAQRAESLGRFVADATRALNATLDEETTVAALARLAVEGFADWCAIDLVGPDGRLAVSAIEHRDPGLAALARSLREQYPLDPDGPVGPYAVLRSGAAQLLPELPATVVDDVTAGDPEQLAIIERLAIRSFMCVPLAVHGSVLGTLSAVASDSGRRFTERDLHVAEEVAGRAAAALQNARLFARIQHHAQEERTRAAELDAVIMSMQDGVLVTDPAGRIVLRNAAATAILGSEPATFDSLAVLFAEPASVPAPGSRCSQLALRLAGAAERWVEVTASPVSTPETSGWVLILRDVTRRHLTEAVRDTFIDVLSHELRTPVTSIYVAADLLLGASGIDDRTRELLSDLHAEVERLRILVEDVVALTRFGEGGDGQEILGEPILVQRVAQRAIDGVRSRYPAVTFQMAVSPALPAARADGGYVEHVLRNILGNAAKFGGPGTTVEVRIEPDGPAVLTTVLDTGPGFPAGEEERIFERFYRSPTTAGTASGSGIGLFVAARLVAAMGGQIRARRRLGGGAEVSFTLPQADEG